MAQAGAHPQGAAAASADSTPAAVAAAAAAQQAQVAAAVAAAQAANAQAAGAATAPAAPAAAEPAAAAQSPPESDADKQNRRQRQWQLLLEASKRELGTGDHMQKLVTSLDAWSATMASLGSGGVLVEHSLEALQQQAVAGLSEVDVAIRAELEASSGGPVEPEAGLQPYEQAGQRLAKQTGGGLTSASKAVATLREAGGTSSSVAAMALVAELDGAVSRAVGVRYVGQPAAAGGAGTSSRAGLSSARAAKEGAIVAAHADTTADDMANAGWDPDTEAADQQTGSSSFGAAASAGAHPWAAVVDEAVAVRSFAWPDAVSPSFWLCFRAYDSLARKTQGERCGIARFPPRDPPAPPLLFLCSPLLLQSVRSDYVTWWSSRKQKWDASVARAKGPTSFKLPAPPASASSDVGALLRQFFRTEFTEVFLHGQGVTDEGLKDADERDRHLARAERECRAQWSALLGAPRLTEAAKEAVAAAAEDAADLATGGGPATKYIAASMLAADAPASELRQASLKLALVLASARASAAARRELSFQYSSVVAAAQHTSEAVLTPINEQRNLRSVTAFLQSEVRLLVCEAATARFVATQTLASALTPPSGPDPTQIAGHFAMFASSLAKLAEPPLFDPASGTAIASVLGSCIDIEAQRQQAVRIEEAAAIVSAEAKQFIRHLLPQLRDWMKGQNNGQADAALVASIDNTANTMVKQAHDLSADSKRIVDFTIRLLQAMYLAKPILGSTSALPPDDVPIIDANSLLVVARPEAGLAAAEAIGRDSGRAAREALVEAHKARLVTADDVAAALALAAERRVPGARDAFRRAALSVSDGPAGAKQMATLPERELVATAVEAQRRGRYVAQLELLVQRHKLELGASIRQKREELQNKHNKLAASLASYANEFALACERAGAPIAPRTKRPRPEEQEAAAPAADATDSAATAAADAQHAAAAPSAAADAATAGAAAQTQGAIVVPQAVAAAAEEPTAKRAKVE